VEAGTRGIILKEMCDEHIEAILETQDQIPDWVRTLFENEQIFRKEKEAIVKG